MAKLQGVSLVTVSLQMQGGAGLPAAIAKDIQVPCYRSLHLLRMHTKITFPGEVDIYFGLYKRKYRKGKLLVVGEGRG